MMAVFNVDSRSGAHRGEWSPGNFVPDCWAAANFAGLDTGPRLRAVRFALIFGFRMARLCRLSPPFWHSSPARSDTYWPAVALAWQFAGEQGTKHGWSRTRRRRISAGAVVLGGKPGPNHSWDSASPHGDRQRAHVRFTCILPAHGGTGRHRGRGSSIARVRPGILGSRQHPIPPVSHDNDGCRFEHGCRDCEFQHAQLARA